MFVEARHQPELHLIVRNINFGMTINNDGDGYDGQGGGDHSDDVDDDDEDADAGGIDGDDVDHGVTCSPSPLLSTPRNCRMLSWLSCKSSLNIFYRHVTKKIKLLGMHRLPGADYKSPVRQTSSVCLAGGRSSPQPSPSQPGSSHLLKLQQYVYCSRKLSHNFSSRVISTKSDKPSLLT